MHIEIYEYVDGDESCDAGDYLGYVSLEEDDVYIDVDNDDLAEQLEKLFSKPILLKKNIMPGTPKEAEPYTREFFRCVLPLLHDLNARGLLKDEDSDRYQSREVPSIRENDDEEEEDQLPVDMELNDINTMDDSYGIEDPDDEEKDSDDYMDEDDDESDY